MTRIMAVFLFAAIGARVHAAPETALKRLGTSWPRGKGIGSPAPPRGDGQGAGATFCDGCLAGPVPCGGTVTGSLEPGDCFFSDQSFFDFYELVIPPGKLVDLRLSTAAFDAVLFVMDEACRLLMISEDCTGVDTDSCLLAMQLPGRYFVGVNSFAGGETGDYTLEVTCSDNGVCACTAQPIVCGNTQGQLGTEDCSLPGNRFHDVFRFEVTASSLVNISVADAVFTPALTVVDSTCNAVASPNFCPENPCLSLALEPGVYFINLTNAEPLFFGASPYTMDVSCHDLAFCRDCTVGALGCDSGAISGNLSATTCTRPNGASVDMYQLEIPELTEVSVSLRSAAFDPHIFILDRFCEPVASSEDCGVMTGEACLELRPLRPGSYLVGVSSAQPGATGRYEIAASCKAFSPCGCDTRSIACGEKVSGTLSSSDCVLLDDTSSRTFFDTWKLELPGAQRVTIDLSSADFHPILYMYDSTCAYKDACAPSDVDPRCAVLDLPAGTYYLLPGSNWLEPETGAYELGVSCTDITYCQDCVVGPISCGRSVNGFLASRPCRIDEQGGFVDIYELELPEATRVDIGLTAEFAARLVLLDSECVPVESFCAPGSTDPSLSCELPAGRFFIGASAYTPGIIGQYTLSVSSPDCNACSSCRAGTVSCDAPVTGSLEPGDCALEDGVLLDVWTLELTEPQDVAITAAAEFDPVLRLFDATCSVAAENDDCDPETLNACLRQSLPPGTHSIAVTSSMPGATGDYSLRVSCPSPQLPGDCTQDGSLDIADGVCLLGFLFLGRPGELPCGGGRITDPGNILLLDFDGQGTLDLSDAVASFLYLFSGSPPHPLGTACVPIAGCEPKCGG